MTPAEFSKRHPYLFHMAHPSALASIERHGLLSTQALARLLDLPPDEQSRLCTSHRPETRALSHPLHGTIHIRDQKPINEICLARCLEEGLTPADWYRTLNERSFLWADRSRLDGLRNAQTYRHASHLILTLDAASFVANYYNTITVSTFNTGYARRKARQRGPASFIPLRDFPSGPQKKKIVEVTVPGGIPDLRNYLCASEISTEALKCHRPPISKT